MDKKNNFKKIMYYTDFIRQYKPLADKAGAHYRLNPVIILAQAAIETGWGESALATEYHNFFGLTAYGLRNAFWNGTSIELGKYSLKFRVYSCPDDSFLDYARLIREVYPNAAEASYDPVAFALAISYSRYISEVNGDNREEYRNLIVVISDKIGRFLKKGPELFREPNMSNSLKS